MNRGRAALAMIAGLGMALQARGQIEMGLSVEYASCLQFEPVHAIVTVHNETARPLRICGADTPGCMELTFQIERQRMDWLPKTRDGAVISGVTIDPGETRRMAVDITRWYRMSTMGRYLVKAVLRQGDEVFFSPQVMIDVVRGMELATVTRFVPGYEKLSRTYSLRYWQRDQQEYLFLVVDEPATQLNYGVFELGRLLRMERPEIKVDLQGNVTIRHRSSSDCFIVTTLKSERDGVQFVDQQYQLPDGSPYPRVESRLHMPMP